jgi:MFS transporter, PAT family, solute carrier family 33 (acetyl-CoA transportor), member 1
VSPVFFSFSALANLVSVSNLGGTFPRYFVLKLVDSFTVATCHPPADGKDAAFAAPFSCAMQADKEMCEKGGGTCEMVRDGYYTVNILCVLFGVATFVWYIRPKVLQLQELPLRAWRLAPKQ